MPSEAASKVLSNEWHRHIDAWRASGESQQTFCKQHKLNYPHFLYWRCKLDEQSEAMKPSRGSALVRVTYQAAVHPD